MLLRLEQRARATTLDERERQAATVVMPENAMLALHDPSGVVVGTTADMRVTGRLRDGRDRRIACGKPAVATIS